MFVEVNSPVMERLAAKKTYPDNYIMMTCNEGCIGSVKYISDNKKELYDLLLGIDNPEDYIVVEGSGFEQGVIISEVVVP